jgi:hypothetical protein
VNDGDPLYWDEAQSNIDVSENYDKNYDELTDFDAHWENTIGSEWDDDYHDSASSIVDESGWEELDSKSSDGSNGTRLDTDHPTGSTEQNDNASGGILSADNTPGASADDNASVDMNEVFNTEPIAVGVDDTGPQTSRILLRRRKVPSSVYEEPFCSDCESVIPAGHLLKCSEPSCTEKVSSSMYNAVLQVC